MKRRLTLFVPAVVFDRTSAVPLHQQIRDQIALAIRAGAAGPASRLPSTRAFARMLRVSRNTVMTAYDALAADDLIRGEHGSGMRVNAPNQVPEASRPGLKGILRAAQYPVRTLSASDPDGNPLVINY